MRLFFLLVLLLSNFANAGVFNIPSFLEPGKFSLGVEPEVTLTDGAGLGVNFKYTQGVSDLINLQGLIGTGGGPRQFRVGGSANFDFFPDTDRQPGIGVATRAIWYQLPNNGQLELQAIPYIHKSFHNSTGGADVDPFLAVPIGYAFATGNYTPISSIALGCNFKQTEHITYIAELGVNINSSESTVSGGLVWQP